MLDRGEEEDPLGNSKLTPEQSQVAGQLQHNTAMANTQRVTINGSNTTATAGVVPAQQLAGHPRSNTDEISKHCYSRTTFFLFYFIFLVHLFCL